MPKLLVPLVAGAATLALGAGGFVATPIVLAADATLVVDGQPRTVRVFNDTVGSVLAENGITVGEHDVVAPAPDTKVSKGSEITVRYGRPVTVVVDGVPQVRWTTATTVGEALAVFGVQAEGAQVSVSRNAEIGREGLSIDVTTPRDVTITVDGQTRTVSGFGAVGDLLMAQGIELGAADIVTPGLATTLTDGMAVTVVRVTTQQVTKEVPIPFETTTTEDPTLAKGTTKVTTEGVNGVSTETWTQTLHDGQVASEERVSSVVSKAPVTKVTKVGTKTTASSSSDGSGPATGTATGNSCGVSYYTLHGSKTANGETFDMYAYTAAHKTLKFNTMVKVTNPATGKSVVVRINDRGPYISGRCLDLSYSAFQAVSPVSAGHFTGTWEVVG